MKPSKKTGLRKKIVLAMMLMALLPVLLGLLLTSLKGTAELRKAIGKNFEGLAKEAASKTGLAIEKELSELKHLAAHDDVQKALVKANAVGRPEASLDVFPLPPDPDLIRLLDDNIHTPEHEIILHSLTLTNSAGIRIASSSDAPKEPSFLGKERWWEESARGGKGAVYLGSIYPADSGRNDFLFDMAVSVGQKETDEFSGVLKGTYYLKPFLKPFIFDIQFGSTGHAMLIDSTGVVIICPILATGSHVADPHLLEAVTSSRPGWITARNDGHGGTDSIVGFAPVKVPNTFVTAKENQWHSFIRQEPSETYAPVQSLLGTVFLSGSLLVGLTCILGLMVSGKLVKPLLLLHEGAEHVRKGDLGYRLRIRTNDEIEAVADKFNEMAEKLSESHATLEHKVLARTRELQALNQIASTVNQSLELQGLLDAALEKVVEVTPFESGYIELLDSESGRLLLRSHRGFAPELLDRFLSRPESQKFSREVAETQRPIVFENSEAFAAENLLSAEGYQTLIAFPIQSKNRIVGVFTLASRTPHSLTAQDLQLLSSIGNQMGTAVENAHLYQKEQGTVEKLVEMDRIKSEFLSNISHELRTPLTSIIGFSEILLDKLSGELTPEQESYIKNMNISGQHLLEIINNILDLSKIKAGKMEVHAHFFSMRALLETIQQTILPMTYKKELRFELSIQDELDAVYTDEGKIKQILLNVLGNAVKFTPAKGQVELHVKKGWLRGRPGIEFRVQDSGIGIPTGALNKIFDEFKQIDGSYTRDYPGTGLGLAITKRFVEILEGEIEVDSQAGVGTTFKILVPIQTETTEPSRHGEPLLLRQGADGRATENHQPAPDRLKAGTALLEAVEEERPKILVVEDDPAVAKLIALYLVQEGYAVEHAVDGEEAIEKAQEVRPFAITLDVMLPRLDGWEVLKKLKTLPATSDIPVIIVSIVQNPTLGFSLGAVDYFTKPIDRKGLTESLKKYSRSSPSKRKPMNLLVIGQDPDALGEIGSILEKERFGVISAAQGVEGVSLAIEIQPDLILLDITMENISGFETIHRLKEHPTAKSIPIILFASRELTQEEKQTLDGQVREIIYKGPSLKDNLIHEVRKFEKLYPDKAKMIDGLTGLYNERYLNNRLSDEVNRAFRYKRTFSLLLTNVDRFQQLNRRYGTEAGDYVLREIALIYRKNSRASNPLCRCGGSTFALLMPETTKDSARLVAEKLRRLIESQGFSMLRQPEIVTVSIGISTFFEDANTSEKMIIQAGAALRHAQQLDGNRIMTVDKVQG